MSDFVTRWSVCFERIGAGVKKVALKVVKCTLWGRRVQAKVSSCAALEQYLRIANHFGRHSDFKAVITQLLHGRNGNGSDWLRRNQTQSIYFTLIICTLRWRLLLRGIPCYLWNEQVFDLLEICFICIPSLTLSHSVSAHVQLAVSDKSEPTATFNAAFNWT